MSTKFVNKMCSQKMSTKMSTKSVHKNVHTKMSTKMREIGGGGRERGGRDGGVSNGRPGFDYVISGQKTAPKVHKISKKVIPLKRSLA